MAEEQDEAEEALTAVERILADDATVESPPRRSTSGGPRSRTRRAQRGVAPARGAEESLSDFSTRLWRSRAGRALPAIVPGTSGTAVTASGRRLADGR